MRPRPRDDGGVYAILYALLVLVVLGMAAIVLDLGLLRADKRDSRSAADTASLAGSAELGQGPWNPLAACETAWDYALDNLGLPDTDSPCGDASPGDGFFNGVAGCPTEQSTATNTEPVEGASISITWPVPSTSTMLTNPDGRPESAPDRVPEPADGEPEGCDKLGVSIVRQRDLGFASALGTSSGTSYAGSVARFDPDGGPSEEVAALNVLEPKDCGSLVTTGNGKVLVSPTVDEDGLVVGPGIIAAESSGLGTCPGSEAAGARVIDPTTGLGSLICASTVILNSDGTNCDGLGDIRSHALDPDQNAIRAYREAAFADNLKPKPTPENGRKGWDSVTKKYGCEILGASLSAGPCVVEGDNHIDELVDALGGIGVPAANYVAESPYVQPYPGGFTLAPAACPGGPGIKTPVTLEAGNWYANCTININAGGSLILKGGTLVVQGGITVAADGCLVVNHTTCTPVVSGAKTSSATTDPAPAKDALIFLRGTTGCPPAGCFDVAGTLVMPRTFVYSKASAAGINIASTKLTLWTAPGAGTSDAAGRTLLENQCLVTTATGSAPSADCLNSRFSRLTYWSELASSSSGSPKANGFAGQGALDVVGVFFTPRAYFNFTGGGTYTGASAQFWADVLNVNGGANLGLRPDARFSIANPTSRVQLIR